MKLIPLCSLLLTATLFPSMLVSCQNTEDAPATTEPTTVTTEPAAPSVTPGEHLHFEGADYPDTVDFSDEEAVERLFDMCEITDGINVTVQKRSQQIRLRGKVNGETFSLTIGLSKSGGHTTPEQIVTCAKLYWYCYPQMYARFAMPSTPKDIILNFEDEGYEVAHASGNVVHIHDQWLKNNPQDFDCLTHEFSHIVQGGWDGNYVPAFTKDDGEKDTYMIERFADYCRYLYAYKDGYYNDMVWTLHTVKGEDTYYRSVRFFVWLDYTYSTAEIDIMQRLQQAVLKKTYPNDAWEPAGEAWVAMFEGTNAAGKDLNALWEEYAASNIANETSKPREQGGKSSLLKTAPLREALRERYPEADDHLKVQ